MSKQIDNRCAFFNGVLITIISGFIAYCLLCTANVLMKDHATLRFMECRLASIKINEDKGAVLYVDMHEYDQCSR